GSGRYQGLISLNVGEGDTEFLLLEYEGGDKLYVPVSQLGVIGRYSGAQPKQAPRSRCATRRPSYWRCTRSAPPAWGIRSPSSNTTSRRSPTASASRRRRTRPRRSRR